MINWKERGRASGIHLCISLLVALVAGTLMFALWFPYPYREISGGRELFMLVVGVDVVLGPLITFMIFNRTKPWRELRRDLASVGVLQMAFLAYGLWSVSLARPVHLVWEIDRFRVVHAADIPEELMRGPAGAVPLPWTGPTLIAARPFRNANEDQEATLAALEGLHIGARPELWQPYDAARARISAQARPATELKSRFAALASQIDEVLRPSGRSIEGVAYVPMVGRNSFWTAFVDAKSADVIAFMPLDPF